MSLHNPFTSVLNVIEKLEVIAPVRLSVTDRSIWSEGKAICASLDAEIASDGVLISVAGYGSHITAAVENLWSIATETLSTEYLVVDADGPNRKAWRWNNRISMWVPVVENNRVAA